MAQTDSTYTPFYEYTLTPIVTDFDSVSFSLEAVFDSIEHKEVVETESMFKEHELQVTHHQAALRPQSSPESWIFLIIIGIVISICTYFRRRRINILDILQSSIDHRSMNRTMREYNLSHHTALLPIVLLWSSTFAMLIYYLTANTIKEFIPIHGAFIYTGLFIGCILFYFLRNGLFKLMGQTFRVPESTELYIMSNYIYSLIESIALPPMLLLVFYGGMISDISVKITIILLAILYIMRLFRSLKLFLTYTKFSQLHLFYYLCILEIMPIMVLLYGIIYM